MKRKSTFKIEYVAWMLALWAVINVLLKLPGIITWPWWLVLAPLWLPFVLVYVPVLLYGYFFYLNHNKNSRYNGKKDN